METNKQFLSKYLLKFRTNDESRYLVGLSLELVNDNFNTLALPNCRNFVFGLRYFLHSAMKTINNIMAFKDHYVFKFIHGSRFPRQSNDKIFVFEMSADLPGSGVELVKICKSKGGGTWAIM